MTTTLDQSYQSQPLTVAQGGTGVATNTTYSLLAGGTTSTAAIQQAGTGASKQIYLSGGSAALGTWTTAASASAMQYISSTSASSSASIAITGLTSSYFMFKIIIDELVPATNGTNLQCQFSSDGGSTYHNSSGNYLYINKGYAESGTSVTPLTSASDTKIILGPAISNTAGFSNHWEITIINPSATITNNGLFWYGRMKATASSAGISINFGDGNMNVNSAFNAIKFLMSSGNISTGTFSLWGLLT